MCHICHITLQCPQKSIKDRTHIILPFVVRINIYLILYDAVEVCREPKVKFSGKYYLIIVGCHHCSSFVGESLPRLRCQEVLKSVSHKVLVKLGCVLDSFVWFPCVVVFAEPCPLDEYLESSPKITSVSVTPRSPVLENLFYEKLLFNVLLNNSGVRVFALVVERMYVRLVSGKYGVCGYILEFEYWSVNLHY
jgi:hypothetical protein